MRAVRLAGNSASGESALPRNLFLVTETNLAVIFAHIQTIKPALVVIDSIKP